MRHFVDRSKLQRFMEELGNRATSPGTVYLTGGSTALLLGFREQTVDIDIKLDPEPAGAFRAIADLKESLELSVELASPDQFIPALPGWRERSEFITIEGQVTFRHFDFYSQALAKIERGHDQDLRDATAFVSGGHVDPNRLRALAEAVVGDLVRYPAVSAPDFLSKLDRFLSDETQSSG